MPVREKTDVETLMGHEEVPATKEEFPREEAAPGVDVAKEAARNTINQVGEKFEERHKKLVESLSRETNIALRYELKIRLEEIVALYNEIAEIVK